VELERAQEVADSRWRALEEGPREAEDGPRGGGGAWLQPRGPRFSISASP
jgi:hypothetical protein